MNWQEIKQSIIEDLNSRKLKDPNIRIRALNKIENLLNTKLPQYINSPDCFKSISKDKFKRLLSGCKEMNLNGAENSIVNEIYYRV